MKQIFIALGIFVAGISTGFAQQAVPDPAPVTTVASVAIAKPLSDSMRQQVHKLFKWGRLCSTVGALSGGILVSSAVSYIARRDDDWSTGVDLCLGTNALAFGTMSMIRFSRKRERQVLAALEQGQPLPEYVSVWLPLVNQSKQPKRK